MITNPGCDAGDCPDSVAIETALLQPTYCTALEFARMQMKLHQKYSPCANAKARATDASRAQTPAGAFGLADCAPQCEKECAHREWRDSAATA
jgi:hypothetical protein